MHRIWWLPLLLVTACGALPDARERAEAPSDLVAPEPCPAARAEVSPPASTPLALAAFADPEPVSPRGFAAPVGSVSSPAPLLLAFHLPPSFGADPGALERSFAAGNLSAAQASGWSASAQRKRRLARGFSASRCSQIATERSLKSTPTIEPTRSASAKSKVPQPHPRSTTRSSGPGSWISSTLSTR